MRFDKLLKKLEGKAGVEAYSYAARELGHGLSTITHDEINRFREIVARSETDGTPEAEGWKASILSIAGAFYDSQDFLDKIIADINRMYP